MKDSKTQFRKNEDLSFFDKKTVLIHDLELIITQKCNFSCAHCMRGDGQGKNMTSEVMDAVFSKFPVINNLALGGGEVTLAPEVINQVYESLHKNKVHISMLNFTTNGTIYSQEFVDAIKKIKEYILECRKIGEIGWDWSHKPIAIRVSLDDFHLSEMHKKNISFDSVLKNIRKLQEEFGEESVYATYNSNYDIIDEGRAKDIKVDKPKIKRTILPICFLESKKTVAIDSVMCISTTGECIPVNISYENENILSFGNIVKENLSAIMQKQKLIKTHSPNQLDHVNNKLMKKYMYIPYSHLKKYFNSKGVKSEEVIAQRLKYENMTLKNEILAEEEQE